MEDYAERIVDRAVDLGCQDAVADVSVNRSYQIRCAQNQIVISNQGRETSASVFLVYDKRVVASDIKDLTKLDAAMEGLVKVAKASQENPEYAGIAKGPFKYDRLSFDRRIVDLADGSDHVQAAVNGAPPPPSPSPPPRRRATRRGRSRPSRRTPSAGRRAGTTSCSTPSSSAP